MTLTADFGIPVAAGDPEETPCSLVVGNFDGVHLGHQRLLARARELVEPRAGQVLAATFIPHPRWVLRGPDQVFLLTPSAMRRRLLKESGVDRLLVLPFGQHLRDLSPQAFLDRLRARYRIQGIVAGPRVSIGRGGSGGLEFLSGYCLQEGIQLEVVPPVEVAGQEVSSSAIRQHLAEGRLDLVEAMLGRPFCLLGEVEHGDGRGHRLGFATANLRWSAGQALPPDGVYVMTARAGEGRRLPAVGSLGSRPQYGPGPRKLEVHCLEDPGPLYGRVLLVEILARLRDQATFPSESELAAQIGEDSMAARKHLAERGL